MSKQLCDLKNWLKSDLKAYAKLVQKPTHVCVSCGRAANKKKKLCSPVKMK